MMRLVITMPQLSLLIAALLLSLGHSAPKLARADGTPLLDKFVESMKWNPAKLGPLIVIEPDKAYRPDEAPNTLAGYERKLVKFGKLNVIALSWTTALSDADIPNAYDSLSESEKLTFLMATMKPSDLAKLCGSGVSADELSGQQKAAVLSMIPKPLNYMVGNSTGNGFRGNGEPNPLPEDQYGRVKVQLFRGLVADLGRATDKNGRKFSTIIDSLACRVPGTPMVSMMRGFMTTDLTFKGHIVDNTLKKSDLDWNDSRLAKAISLAPFSPVAKIVEAVREQTGVEVYADKRISALRVVAYGDSVSASDLLRGLALGFAGTFRKVGTAYVLTANTEGEESLTNRLLMQEYINSREIQADKDGWQKTVAERRVLESLRFSPDDYLHAGSIPENLISPGGPTTSDSGWASLSQLPNEVTSVLFAAEATQRTSGRDLQADPDFAGKVRFTTMAAFRFVLPDGRPLQGHRFEAAFQPRLANDQAAAPSKLPLDPAAMKGSAVAIRSNDAGVVTNLCREIKTLKIDDVWLDSDSPEAVEAAVASGLGVDLVIHPWRVMTGESCSEPDRNVVGQTGKALNEVPTARFDPKEQRLRTYYLSFAPDANIADHLKRIVRLASVKGIRKLIVEDAQLEGYQEPKESRISMRGGGGFITGRSVEPGLRTRVDSLFQFGYSTRFRLQFLRNYHIDPIDVLNPFFPQVTPISPYFDVSPEAQGMNSPYPSVFFPWVPLDQKVTFMADWDKLRYDAWVAGFGPVGKALTSIGVPVFGERARGRAQMVTSNPMGTVFPMAQDGTIDTKADSSEMCFIAVGPSNAEDAEGQFIYALNYIPRKYPLCIDLTDVPAQRVPFYLHNLFKTH